MSRNYTTHFIAKDEPARNNWTLHTSFIYTESIVAIKAAEGQTILVEPEPKRIRSTTIVLPDLVIDDLRIGKNKIVQIGSPGTEVDVELFQYTTEILKGVLKDGSVIYIKLPGSKESLSSKDVLKINNFKDVASINESSRFSWLSHRKMSSPKSPQDINRSWANEFSFHQESSDGKKPGLRKPQLGAIYATAAHLSVKSSPATIVMPTGTGKTDAMIATLVHQQFEKTLVLVPTNPLREQIFKKLIKLGELKKLGVIPFRTLNPRVAIIEHGITNKPEALALLKESNVVVSTVQAIAKSDDAVKAVFAKHFSHLIIDEAHHTPASSWQLLTELFPNKPILQYTATPFRRDGKYIKGDIIYNYPLGMAQDEKYFKKINLVKLQEFDELKSDETIAKAAIEVLEQDLGKPNNLDHIIMARCKDKGRAKEILKIYQRLGGKFNPILITSDTKTREYREYKDALENRASRIVVCIDMLGEGYDLPNLKIAALHDTHKSLAVMLQFVGRFTRVANNVGEATVVLNVNDPQVNKDLESLYSEDPDWNEILREKSESKIQSEIDAHEFIKDFSGELSKHVSLWNLRPSFSTFIFETSTKKWEPEKFADVMPKTYQYWHAINQKEKILVFVISKEEEVKWGKYKDIHNHSFELYVAHWDETRKALFVYGSDYDAINTAQLARAICGDDTRVKNGSKVFNVFAGVERTLARNVGISTVGNISYTMHFGNDITQGLSKVDKSSGVLNNIFAWGYENGDRFAAGSSVKSGKIWSRGGAPILLWKEWCIKMATKVFDKTIKESDITRDFLRPKELTKRYAVTPIVAQWSEGILQSNEDNVTIYIGKEEYKLYEVDLEITEFSDTGPVKFKIFSDKFESTYKIDYGAKHTSYTLVKGKQVKIKRRSGLPISLIDYVVKDPIVIIYIDGSFSYNHLHVPTPKLNDFFDVSNIEVVDWSGTDIKVESMDQDVKKNSIQYKMFELIKNDYDLIFNDDASGEAADLIAIRQESRDTIRLRLIHAKFSSSDKPGARIKDFYEVCGQAQKSIRWKHNGFEYLSNHIKAREALWQKDGYSRFLKGNMNDLNRLKKFSRFAPKFIFEVTIVQPGLSKSKPSTDIIQLLGSTEDYLLKTSNAEFSVIASK